MPSAAARSSPPHWSRWWWVWATATISRTPVSSSSSRIRARTEIDQQPALAGRPQVDVAGVAIPPQRRREPRQTAADSPVRPWPDHAGTASRRAGLSTSIASDASLRDAELAQERHDVLEEVGVAPAAPAPEARPDADVLAEHDPVARSRPRPARRRQPRRPDRTAASGPGPSSEWSKPNRSKPERRASVRRARAARPAGRWRCCAWPRMTRSGSAPAPIRSSRTARPSWPHGWRWTEIARPVAADAAATARRTRRSAGVDRVRGPDLAEDPGADPGLADPVGPPSPNRRSSDRRRRSTSRPTARGPARGTGRCRARRGHRPARRSRGPGGVAAERRRRQLDDRAAAGRGRTARAPRPRRRRRSGGSCRGATPGFQRASAALARIPRARWSSSRSHGPRAAASNPSTGARAPT